MESGTADRIVDAAVDLMADRGYSAFSYADVSDRVGIRKASIHHHFPGKSDLAVVALRRHRQGLERGTRHIDETVADPLGRIRAYVQHWDGCIGKEATSFCIAALLGAELPSLPRDVQAEVRLHFEVLADWLQRTLRAGVTAGVVRLQGPAEVEAQLLMATVHGAMLSARATGSRDTFGAVTELAISRLRPAAT